MPRITSDSQLKRRIPERQQLYDLVASLPPPNDPEFEMRLDEILVRIVEALPTYMDDE